MRQSKENIKTHPYSPDFLFLANNLCLDFINTEFVRWKPVLDLLDSFQDYMDWLYKAEVITEERAKYALDRWSGTDEGKTALEYARKFRAVIRDDMVERIIEQIPVEQSAIKEINSILSSCKGNFYIKDNEDSFFTDFRVIYDEPFKLLYPVARSAADLLCNHDPSLVKKCENSGCMLYFYDTSKNHSRRWCSMDLCGNRMKVASHYRRKKRKKN